ncbi:hypothetical protein J3E68DRAFT_442156 [Trichoderma sp. SZMC 28012]
MDVDSPSNQPVTAASNETDTEIREKKRQEILQARKELGKLVKDISFGLDGLGPEATNFEEGLECDCYVMENESYEKSYKLALEGFKRQWDDAKRKFEQSCLSWPQQSAEDAAAKQLYRPVEKFMAEFQTLQQAFEAEINHPEVSFKKDLDDLRERLEERQWMAHSLKEKLDETVEKLDNVCKRVDELEKLTEQ